MCCSLILSCDSLLCVGKQTGRCEVSQHQITRSDLSMSQPLNSLSLRDPPAHNTRGRQPSEQSTMEATINALQEQLRSLSVTDNLPVFRAGAHEVHPWLARFETFCIGKGWQASRHEKLPMYLGAEEHEWFHDLAEDVKSSYATLKAALIAEYTPKAASQFARETALRMQKQDSSTTVKDFVKIVRREARAIALPEDKGVQIILNNMLPAARATIVTTPTTYEGILATPVARGEIPLPKPATSTDTEAVIQQVLAALDDIKRGQIAAIDAHQTSAAVNTANPARQPWPRQTDSWGPVVNTPANSARQPWPRQSDSWEPRPNARFNQPRRPPPQHQGPPSLNSNNHSGTNNKPCWGCGSIAGRCTPRAACPAYGRICYNCGLPNHLDICCTSNPNAVIKVQK